MCDRNFGIGADGIFSAVKFDRTPSAENVDIAWKFYNSDGSIAQMCGNGIRDALQNTFIDKGIIEKHKFSVQTLAGVIIPEILETGKVCVNMGTPIFDAAKNSGHKALDVFDF